MDELILVVFVSMIIFISHSDEHNGVLNPVSAHVLLESLLEEVLHQLPQDLGSYSHATEVPG